MKKIFCIFLILFIAASAFSDGITVKGTPPKTGVSEIDNALNDVFDDILSDLNSEISKLGIIGVPNNLIQSFGNASVYTASQGATQRGYGGYKKFAITFGPSVGFQLPVSPFEVVDLLSSPGDPLQNLIKDGDATLGFNPQIINAQIGFNTSFLMKNLYLGFRIGYTPDPAKFMGDIEMGGLNFSFTNFLIGATANYQLIPSIGIPGLFTWRGINLGAGFIVQTTKLNMGFPLEKIVQDLEQSNTKIGEISMSPELVFNMDIKTFTIPVEIMTAVKVLFINVPLGLGADFAFGTSSMSMGMRSDITIKDTTGILPQTTPGELEIGLGGEMKPQFMNLKLMTGVGISIGPFLLDVPVTYYFKDNGLSVGVTLGLAF